jgi:hypothetical protein
MVYDSLVNILVILIRHAYLSEIVWLKILSMSNGLVRYIMPKSSNIDITDIYALALLDMHVHHNLFRGNSKL